MIIATDTICAAVPEAALFCTCNANLSPAATDTVFVVSLNVPAAALAAMVTVTAVFAPFLRTVHTCELFADCVVLVSTYKLRIVPDIGIMIWRDASALFVVNAQNEMNDVVDVPMVTATLLISDIESCAATATLPLPNNDVLFTVLMFVPETKAACLALNVDQSELDNAPRFDADAVGKLNV
jgi:hypothetical protein